jgi:hypothetical protein
MTDPLLTDVTLLARFGEESTAFPPFLAPDATALPVIQAVKDSVAFGLKPGWHTATITFELDGEGNVLRLDEYKVSSFGGDHP